MLDLSKIKFLPSPNASRRLAKVTHLVIHAMAGSFTGTQSHFLKKSSKVSAHYLVSKKGEILCMVKPENRAWHVKNFNDRSIGIELEDYNKETKKNCLSDPHWCTEEEYKAAASLAAALVSKYDIPLNNIIPHSDPFLRKLKNTHVDPGPYFDFAKFKALIEEELKTDGSKDS